MPEVHVEQQPSETALLAALRRALAHKEYPQTRLGSDDLAEIFLSSQMRFFLRFKFMRAMGLRRLEGYLPGLQAFMIARTVYFDQLFTTALEAQFPQIVLLGAGYDTRAYRYAARNRATQIFELDISPTQERKKTCLEAAHLPPPERLRLVPIDFNREELAEVLGSAGWQPQERTMFIWEGVTYYLQPQSVDATLEFLSQAAPGSQVAFDYTESIDAANRGGVGVQEFMDTMKSAHAGEALLFSIASGEIETFLADRNLVLRQHLDNQQIEQEFLVDGSGASPGPITAHFRFVLAEPQP